ncbi:zincin-like metallopeptidase toxin 3 of polymorphic toxin system [Aquimarina sp. MAR_2010_214]|uniref:hypothetical protein n=1 Tax=Aquimarina sp. MAR_2010_214 TaxID=1250026 RepID=UPI000C70D5DF|nr:hypothetical protein [Aquimarina sp. MAR_2010_214]PKV48986.1 zincin-like metallopeptidase toxin 3 of polymorphic toxin system [Aquimarina sp. MAR_2010_214]
MKNHFTSYAFMTIAVLLTFFFSSCEKEEGFITESVSLNTTEEHSSSSYTYASGTEVPEVFEAFNIALNAPKSKSFDNVTVDKNQVVELTTLSGDKTYSMLLTVPNTSAYEFYNLVVKKYADGTIGEPFVLQYQTDKKAHEITAEDYNSLNWQITSYEAKDFFGREISVLSSKSSSPCSSVDIRPDTPNSVGGFSAEGSLSSYFIKGKRLPRTSNAGPNGVLGTVTTCVKQTRRVHHQCKGPNSETNHPEGPNSGAAGDGRCGDARSSYSGTGDKLVTQITCIDVNVVVKGQYSSTNAIDGTVIYDYTDIYFNKGKYSLCQLENIYNGLVENQANLNPGGIKLRDRIKTTLGLDGYSSYCSGQRRDGGAVKAHSKGAVGPGSATPDASIAGSQVRCADNIDNVAISTPSEIHNLIKSLKTIGRDDFHGITTAQEKWLLDPKNQTEARKIAYFVESKQGNGEAKKTAKEMIIAAIDGALVSIQPFVKYPKDKAEQYKRDYPALTEFLKNEIPKIANNDKIINEIHGITDAPVETIKEALQWGKGPEIVIEQLHGEGNKEQYGAYRGTFNPELRNKLFIDIDLINDIENLKNSDKFREEIGFLIAVTILHEYNHFGDTVFGNNFWGELYLDDPVDQNEAGAVFEVAIFGETVWRSNVGVIMRNFGNW